MHNPINQYIQDLIIDTVNAVTQSDTTIHIALSHKKISEMKHNKHFTQKTIKHNKTNS